MEPAAPDEASSAPPTLDDALAALDGSVLVTTGVAASSVSARPTASRLTVLVVCAAGAAAGVALVLALAWMRGDAPVHTAAAAAPVALATKPLAAVVAETAPPPTWTGQPKATWANDGSKTISFELQATRDVPVWMSRVRPVLVVRCLSRATEAFVVIGTSLTFEDDAYRRTIRLQWDDGPESIQQWQASESGQELFALDGVAFVRHLAPARRLRFGFTPFNAPPATVEFAVQGFDRLAGLVAGTCGWRL